MNHHRSYPAAPASQIVERLGIIEVSRALTEAGLLVAEMPSALDKGTDLLVHVTKEGESVPRLALVQVKSGRSQTAIKVGSHAHYWADMTLPVFGVTVTQIGAATWVDLREAMRNDLYSRSVATKYPLSTLPEAIRRATHDRAAELSMIDLGSDDPGRQYSAIIVAWSLRNRVDVCNLPRARLPFLAPIPFALAVDVLDMSDVKLQPLCSHEIAAVAGKLSALRIDSHEMNGGGQELVTLINLMTSFDQPAEDAQTAAEALSDPEDIFSAALLAAALQPARDTLRWLGDFSARRHGVAENRDIAELRQKLCEVNPEWSWDPSI